MAKCDGIKYKLSREVKGHTDEVRSLSIFRNGTFVSASRDKTSRFWSGENYQNCVVMTGHSDFVCSVCTIEPTEKNPKGFIVTGSNDKHICVYFPGAEQPICKFQAHDSTVCNLKASKYDGSSFLSCSSDNIGKLWNLNDLKKAEAEFMGHVPDAVIWCIADLPNGKVITGGSDKWVMIYERTGKIIHRLTGHKDCVRDIVTISDSDFLTCGNDAVTKHWNSESGKCLGTYVSHSSHIYNISATLGGSLAVTCGEDKTVKVWRNGEVHQTMMIPVQTTWCVGLLHNEDIICGSSDGIIRIFTTAKERYIDKNSMQKFEETILNTIKNNVKQNKQHEDVKTIPQSRELNQPGENDGDTVIVKVHGKVKAYRWSQNDYQWKVVGDIVETKEPVRSGKPTYNGVEYDYVFAVDIEEGAPMLNLPYNRGQNPDIVAQNFIIENDLNPRSLKRISNFIRTNVQLTPILNAHSAREDPILNGSCYVSNAAASSDENLQLFSFKSYIPQTYFLKLNQGNINNIFDKLQQFNQKPEAVAQKLPEEKLESLKRLINNAATNEESDISDLIFMLNSWPDQLLFPILDIARLVVLNENINSQFCKEEMLNNLLTHLKINALPANQMLTFRLLSNLFNCEAGFHFSLKIYPKILEMIDKIAAVEGKNNEVALSTYILNLAVAMNKANDKDGKVMCLDSILRILEYLKEKEAVFRVLVALGTIILGTSNYTEKKTLTHMAKGSRTLLLGLRLLLKDVEESDSSNKLLSLTKEILDILKS